MLPAGDTALVVELGDTIDLAVNARVRALDRLMAATRMAGIVETLPTNRSLMVVYEPLVLSQDDLVRAIERLLVALPEQPAETGGRGWIVPAVYGGTYGIDLVAVAAALGLDEDAVIARHAASEYRVFMIGFQPGFAYLGVLDPALAVSRHAAPRAEIPAGTISIAGNQTVINSVAAPSGWNLIARTPARLFDRRRSDPFLLAPGDRVRFRPVPAAEWAALAARAEAGDRVAESTS
ncbi:MAG TPA: 5-oxoprolinase subunit PxpB [Stellaceae bacterium]|nr:5-oxoprolinase subunit PxpB [Stellaceae bacterium]